jgi:predicted nucleic acid-binding Zn ribbon protein
MMTVKQNSQLLVWVIAGLVLVGILLYFFGPTALRTDEIIVIGVLILALICFRIWLRWRGE